MADIVLDGVTLPGDLRWTDEYQWCAVERSAEYSLGGSLLIEESTKLAGRPITLEAVNEFRGHIWLDRDTVDTLLARAELTNHSMTLVLSDNRTFTVMFRDDGVKAEPVYHIMPHEDGDPYHLTIKLMTV